MLIHMQPEGVRDLGLIYSASSLSLHRACRLMSGQTEACTQTKGATIQQPLPTKKKITFIMRTVFIVVNATLL